MPKILRVDRQAAERKKHLPLLYSQLAGADPWSRSPLPPSALPRPSQRTPPERKLPVAIVKSRLLIAVIHTNRQRHPTFRGRPIRDDPLRYVELQFETQEAANAAEEQLKGLLKYATEIEFREVGPAVGLEMKKAEVAKRLARYEILQAHKGAAAN